jgi:2-polyprenyl-6-methoxyphenol hydroxylase-like FAD-dependent oxidoreductase
MFGDGSSLAMTGAFTLVDALTVDIPSGLRDYEARHRPQRVAKENAVTPAANLFVPATQVGIAVRNVAVHAMPLVVKVRETASWMALSA